MAKEIIFKTKDGVEVSFDLKQIILKGETIIKFPSGVRWSDGATKQYVYGETYIRQLPDAIINQIGDVLIPKDIEATSEPTESVESDEPQLDV